MERHLSGTDFTCRARKLQVPVLRQDGFQGEVLYPPPSGGPVRSRQRAASDLESTRERQKRKRANQEEGGVLWSRLGRERARLQHVTPGSGSTPGERVRAQAERRALQRT